MAVFLHRLLTKPVRMCCFGWHAWTKLRKRKGILIGFSDNCGYSLTPTAKLSKWYFLRGYLQCGIGNRISESSVLCSVSIHHSLWLWVDHFPMRDFHYITYWSFGKDWFPELCRFSKCTHILLCNVKKSLLLTVSSFISSGVSSKIGS